MDEKNKFDYHDPDIEQTEQYQQLFLDSLRAMISLKKFDQAADELSQETMDNFQLSVLGRRPITEKDPPQPEVARFEQRLSEARTQQEILDLAQTEGVDIDSEDLELIKDLVLKEILRDTKDASKDKPF